MMSWVGSPSPFRWNKEPRVSFHVIRRPLRQDASRDTLMPLTKRDYEGEEEPGEAPDCLRWYSSR